MSRKKSGDGWKIYKFTKDFLETFRATEHGQAVCRKRRFLDLQRLSVGGRFKNTAHRLRIAAAASCRPQNAVLFCGRVDSDDAHHAPVFVLQKVAVIHEGADDAGIAKVHAQFDAGILRRGAIPIGDVDGVAEIGFLNGDPIPFRQEKMDLMDVEGVEFGGAIFDDPVFNVALMDDDVGGFGARIKRNRLFTIDCDVEPGGAVGIRRIERFFGEIEFPFPDGFDVAEPVAGAVRWQLRVRGSDQSGGSCCCSALARE